MALTLDANIRGNGMNQGDVYAFLSNVKDLVNELQTDHATNKTTIDECRTAIVELIDDHATFKTAVDQTETLIEELHDDHATNKTFMDEVKTDYTALLADVTAIRTAVLAITAKLDLDGGVTDTDYAATCDPAALTATSIAASPAATLTAAKPASAPATLAAGDPTASAATLTNSTALTLDAG